MNHAGASAYGLWLLVALNSAIFIAFAFSFTKLPKGRDWRTFGTFSAFVIAFFAEMYGFPLTIYLLSGWLTQQYPGIDFMAHDNGHLWHALLGLGGNPHWDVMHILSFILIGGGLVVLSAAWGKLFRAQRAGRLATTGIYRHIRHPQYTGFILIMLGFLFQWPTLPTIVMFPILVYVYVRLARREEADSLKEFGGAYDAYMKSVPGFIPRAQTMLAKPQV